MYMGYTYTILLGTHVIILLVDTIELRGMIDKCAVMHSRMSQAL